MRTSLFVLFLCIPAALAQVPASELQSPGPQAFQSKEEAKRAGDAALAEGTRLYKQQMADLRRLSLLKFQQAASAYAAAGDKKGEETAWNRCGMASNRLGQRRAAVDFHEKALAIARELQDRRGEADALNYLGIVYKDLGQRQEGLQYYSQALSIRRELGDQAGAAATLNNMAILYASIGQLQKALESCNQALQIAQNLHYRRTEAVTLEDMGTLYDRLGRQREALKYYAQALPISREIGDREIEAGTLDSIGLAYRKLGELQKALDFYQEALAIRRETGNRGGEATALNNLGVVYRRLGDPADALKQYTQALSIDREVGSRASEAVTLNNIGLVYADLGQKPEALNYYVQALPIRREVGDRAGEAATLSNLMSLLHQDEPDVAIVFGKQSVNLYQALRRDISGLTKELQESFAESNRGTYRTLAALLVQQGRLLEAQQILDLLKEEEYYEFIRRSGPVGGTESVAMNARDAAPLVALASERDSLMGKAQLTSDEQKRKEFLDIQMSAAKLVASQFFDESGKVKAVGSAAGAAASARDEEKEAHALQKLLQRSPGTVALYTLVGENSYHTLLITPMLMKAREQQIPAADLRKKIFAWREALRSPSTDPMPLARELYIILIGDLDKELEAAHATTLVWSLDDALRYVPMAALNDGQHYLAERYRSVIRTKASDVSGQRPSEWKALAVGVSEAREGLPPLKGVDEELHAIFYKAGATHDRGVVPASPDILMNAQFSADTLRAGLHQRLPLVHIASHFVLGTDDAASYLLLGSGKLSLAELRTNDDYTFNNVELLTLSACDSAVASNSGDGHEIDGFGFLAEDKGARAVMATLWEVYDPSTSEFMQHFYAELSRDAKTGKAEALQRAQLALLQGSAGTDAGGSRGFGTHDAGAGVHYVHYSHPYYWAPFVLMGDWN